MTLSSSNSADCSATHDSEDALLARAKRAAPDALNRLLCETNWQVVPLPVIEWVSSRKGVCLTAALHGFFNADPMRFNYLHKNEVPAEFKALCRVLDTLCLRMNSGFYDNCALRKGAATPEAFGNWLTCQNLDAGEGHVGRWVLKEDILLANPKPRNRSAAFAELADPEGVTAPKSDWRGDLKQAARQHFGGFSGALNQA